MPITLTLQAEESKLLKTVIGADLSRNCGSLPEDRKILKHIYEMLG
jgi:hypothetical protein